MRITQHFAGLLSALLLLLVFTTPARAQDAAAPAEEKPSLTPGVWALQFGSTGFPFSLESYLGSVVSARYQLAPARAVRFGIGLDAYRDDTHVAFDDQHTTPQQDGTQTTSGHAGENHGDTSRGSLFLEAHYLIYPRPERTMKFFFGFGPAASYDGTDQGFVEEREHESVDDRGVERHSDRTYWSMGAEGLVGGEWFITDQISLSAEYGLGLDYYRSRTESETLITSTNGLASQTLIDGSETYRSDGFRVGPRPVRLGLTLFFR